MHRRIIENFENNINTGYSFVDPAVHWGINAIKKPGYPNKKVGKQIPKIL